MGASLAQYVTARLRRIRIKYRLITSLILLSLLPLLVSGYVSYAESSREIDGKTRLFAGEIVKQVAQNVQLQMTRIELYSEALVLSEPAQAALARYAGPDAGAAGRARADLSNILLGAYGSFDHIAQKYFLDRERRVIDGQVFAQLGHGVSDLAARAPSLKGRPYWSAFDPGSGQHSLVMLREIYFKSDNALAGSLFLGIRPKHFAGIFDDVDLGSGSTVFILDVADGDVIVRASERAEAGRDGVANRALAAAILGGGGNGFAWYAPGKGGTYLSAYTPIPGTSWFVVAAVPYQNVLAEARSVRDKMIAIGLMCLLFAVALAYLIARSITAPLEQLVATMQQAESGNYAIRIGPGGKDELTVLAQKFNHMAWRIGKQHEQMEAQVAERTRDLEEANRQLAALSLTDGLTGVANRRRFDEMLPAELARAARVEQPLALMMIDVDFFKNYNDYYGHQEGDACLQAVARLLAAHARRASDLAARYGGEEFVMLCADTDAQDALALAEAIRAGLEALALPHHQSPIGRVSVSIGVAVLSAPHELQTAERFLRQADKAMYRAKSQGRNQVVLATPA
jgi:diguanylate cyclase (GGDEF)-like protein